MISIPFICHGSMAGSQDLAVLVEQIMAFGIVGDYGFTTSEESKI